jgi:hypothetical protein
MPPSLAAKMAAATFSDRLPGGKGKKHAPRRLSRIQEIKGRGANLQAFGVSHGAAAAVAVEAQKTAVAKPLRRPVEQIQPWSRERGTPNP